MSERPITIGFSNLDEKNPFTVAVRQNLEFVVKQHKDLELVVRDNDMNTEKATANALEFANIPVDIAIIFHIDERAGFKITEPLRRQRIPVIAIDIPIQAAYFFGIDSTNAGTVAGDALADWILANWGGALDKILVMTEYRVLEIFQQRFDYAVRAITAKIPFDKDNLLTIDNGGQAEITAERVQQVLSTWHDLRHIAVICMNDKIALGVLNGARAANRENDIAVLSYDGTEVAIEEFRKPFSRLIVSPSFRADEYGRQLIDLCLRIASGEEVPASTFVNAICLTRDNFEQYI